MKALLDAVVKYMQATSTGFRDFIGGYTSGNNTQMGPFQGKAPSVPPNNTPDFPFVTFDIIAQDSDQGFLVPLQMVEKPLIRFHLYDDDPDRISENLETFTDKMDTLMSLDLGAGEMCRSIIRRGNAVQFPEPISKGVRQSFHWMVSYEFRNARNRGG
jgi:hypothetical protein